VVTIIDPYIWKQKAMAFVTRCHRHLWGKNNEDPLIFLYHQGLTHDFIRQMHLGWNKHSQHRDLTKWGLSDADMDLSRVLIPAGIVFPHIVDKTLVSVVTLPMTADSSRPWLLPGSGPDIILGHPDPHTDRACNDIFAGLRAFQESGTPFAWYGSMGQDQ
jgi:hypothetical protein